MGYISFSLRGIIQSAHVENTMGGNVFVKGLENQYTRQSARRV